MKKSICWSSGRLLDLALTMTCMDLVSISKGKINCEGNYLLEKTWWPNEFPMWSEYRNVCGIFQRNVNNSYHPRFESQGWSFVTPMHIYLHNKLQNHLWVLHLPNIILTSSRLLACAICLLTDYRPCSRWQSLMALVKFLYCIGMLVNR